MKKLIDLTGQRFGQLTATREIIERKSRSHRFYECTCSCGSIVQVAMNHLRTGHTLSCGCVQKERASVAKKTHGKSVHCSSPGIPEYTIWQGMKDRCTNPNNKRWRLYGGRGITVCNEWLSSFEAFFSHVGERPTKSHSIDRINNDGNYEPGNVRWATRSEQMKNRGKLNRPSRFFIPSPDGSRLSLVQISKQRGIKYGTLLLAYHSGKNPLTYTPQLRRVQSG